MIAALASVAASAPGCAVNTQQSNNGSGGGPNVAPRGFRPAIRILPPLNDGTADAAELLSVSCTSDGNCSAVGSYFVSEGTSRAMAATESSGAWQRAVSIQAPENALGTADIGLDSVSCSSGGNCVAVGQYTDTSRRDQLMSAIEHNGNWGRATELPALGSASPPLSDVYRPTISCTSANNCSVESTYIDNASAAPVDHTMVIRNQRGVWGKAITLPAPAGSNDNMVDISCPSADGCVVVGFLDGLGSAATESDGVWRKPVVVTRPVGSGFNGIACTSVGNCVAVGVYLFSVNQYAMEATESRGVWGPGRRVDTPPTSPAGRLLPSLSSVSCIALANCVGVGDLTARGTATIGGPFSASDVDGRWYRGIAVELPADFAKTGQPDANMASVSCTHAGSCVAVGYYAGPGGLAAMAAST